MSHPAFEPTPQFLRFLDSLAYRAVQRNATLNSGAFERAKARFYNHPKKGKIMAMQGFDSAPGRVTQTNAPKKVAKKTPKATKKPKPAKGR